MKVTLGGIQFDPGPRREIRLGGAQVLARQDIPGAGPTYQDMGPDEEPIAWEGALVGSRAVETALAIDAMRKRGGVVELHTWQVPMRRVLIKSFEYKIRRQDRVDYDISLVVQGTTPDFTPPPDPPSDEADSAAAAARLTSATHVVTAGDTLWAVAQRYMGDGSLWPAIAEANGITDPRTLQVGQPLTVPNASEAPTLAAQHQAVLERRNRLFASVGSVVEQPMALPE